ncbi:MAG: hypothetical protein E7536_11020 [Ruminococcaceae bacterium]|nr:hypothetical protein [Oscillospiraceae bacterium]
MSKRSTETVFLTVGTSEQKLMSEKLIGEICDRYSFDIRVVCDEDFGCRIGSGGALINVIGNNYGKDKKLLVVNSGGMSKRSINYSVRGKSFANVIVDGETFTLLELLLKNAERVLNKVSAGVVVCCSDIIVDTEKLVKSFENNVGLAVKTDFETGSRHGVMLCDKNGIMQEYPHKISADELYEKCIEYNMEKPSVDTGFIYLNDELSTALLKMEQENKIIDKLVSGKIDLNLYPEIIALLSQKIDREKFLKEDLQNEIHLKIREILFDVISPFSLEVSVLEDQKFLHMGTAKESLANIFELAQKDGSYININSFVNEKSFVGENTVLDNVILEAGCKIGSGCLVSDITFSQNVEIHDNRTVCGIKLADGGFVTIICDIKENPKEKIFSEELWYIPRFYKGNSFTDSYLKFVNSSDEEKLSLDYCTKNADADYYLARSRYIKDKKDFFLKNQYKKIREEVIKSFFETRKKLKEIKCFKDKAETELPIRVNLSGTWTDAMPYCIDNGGEVINVAVKVDGEKPIRVKIEKLDEKVIEFVSDGKKKIFVLNAESDEDDLSDFNLHRAVLETVGIDKNTSLKNGFRLSTEVISLDKGSGLGISSILLAGCFKVFDEMFNLGYDEKSILKMVFVAEQVMKTGGGWQDQAGGIFPGVKITSSLPGIEQELSVRQIELSETFKRFFSEKIILVPTGQRHFGRFIVGDVADRYLEKNEEALIAYKEIKELNVSVCESFEKDDFKKFKECLNEHFDLLKKISPKVTTDKIEKLTEELLQNFADAVSICGAGGGGYLLAVLKENVTAEDVQEFIKNRFTSIDSTIKRLDISY